MHRDNLVFCCCKTVLCPILKQWEKVLRVVRKITLSTSHALLFNASKSPLVNVRLHKTPVISKVIIVMTSNIHVNRLARHLAGNKRNTVYGEAYIFKGDVYCVDPMGMLCMASVYKHIFAHFGQNLKNNIVFVLINFTANGHVGNSYR